MKKIFLVCFSAVIILSSCNRTIYVVRHGEKAVAAEGSAAAKDPQLSEAGKVRAIVLRDLLKGKNIQHIYSTQTIRTTSTAKPLSEQTGLPIEIYNSDSLDYFIPMVKQLKKGNVLIVGHSNTVDDVVNKLCDETKVADDLQETEFDNFFVVKLKGKKAKFSRTKYGNSETQN